MILLFMKVELVMKKKVETEAKESVSRPDLYARLAEFEKNIKKKKYSRSDLRL